MLPLKDEYNIFAGKNIQRIEALSDGVFSIAMTILVLGLTIPFLEAVHTEGDLGLQLLSMAPKLLVYFMSFITLGLFWTGQTVQYTHITKSDRHLNWITIFYLMFIVLIPFSTVLLGEYITFKLAIGVYCFNMLLLALILYMHWQYAFKSNLVSRDIPDYERVDKAMRNRLIRVQIVYVVGALLCFISTYLSIGFILLFQLNYALPPNFRANLNKIK